MNFTFGIITAGQNDIVIEEIIESIEKQNIPNYEIIIVGRSIINKNNVRVVEFNETISPSQYWKTIMRDNKLFFQPETE